MSLTTKPMIIGFTEPSAFTSHVIDSIHELFNAAPLKISQDDPDHIKYFVDQCDAIILSGGVDLHPRMYGETVKNHQSLGKFDPKRDLREAEVIDLCIKRHIPMLGICRGHQAIGVYYQMPFIQDISSSDTCHQPNYEKIGCSVDEPMHWVNILPQYVEKFKVQSKNDPRYSRYPGTGSDPAYLFTNSFHHQAILYNPSDQKTEDYEIVGVAAGREKERIVEIMQGVSAPWLSVQWHPEYDWKQQPSSAKIWSLFADLIKRS